MEKQRERIHVAVRARPLSAEDAKTSPWRISGNSIAYSSNSSKFEFDRIFGEECRTAEVYGACTKELVAGAVRGFNGTVFAYGQTNSGKTHTMRGSAVEPGVIPLAVQDLFNIIQEDPDREFLLRMSYMEIYNEDINDLMAPEHRKLQIHESPERGIFVAGLREEIVATPEQVMELMAFGESHRHIGETNMNLYSSRSHTIFRMIIESRDKNEVEDQGGSCDAVRVSVLNLVDLAGSERAAKTGAEGVRFKEGSYINKSLMTLGTVIKKLSEGAESQGGHVPYRDSKLTRILQPALGGNANTAIICNITLAQIHADETKSSLQFASRALRVTNCAHVNEILTDAALLRRQKKEIEELQAKLLGSHSEHFQAEILNLRNRLLQTELERERIAMELEEGKRFQAEREKRLQEQAKKIENLSTMVLNSNRDENRDQYKKGKRRDTWCPGIQEQEKHLKLQPTVGFKDYCLQTSRPERVTGPLLPFSELDEMESTAKPQKSYDGFPYKSVSEERNFPKPPNLMHITSRKKKLLKNQCSDLDMTQTAERQKDYESSFEDYDKLNKDYEDLLLEFEMQKTESEIQIACLKGKLDEVMLPKDIDGKAELGDDLLQSVVSGGKNITLDGSEAILVIKHLQEQIEMLEKERSSDHKRLDSVVDLATQQTISASKKYEELYRELLEAQENAKEAQDQRNASARDMAEDDHINQWVNLNSQVQEITCELQASKALMEDMFFIPDELFKSSLLIMKTVPNMLQELKSLVCKNYSELKSNLGHAEKLQSTFKQKICSLEVENNILRNELEGSQRELESLKRNAECSEKALRLPFCILSLVSQRCYQQLREQLNSQESTFQTKVQVMEQQISSLSSCSLAKEKDSLRRDLNKTKSKLKETESKLKNLIQEKTRLEGEKACAEREVKRLQGQKALLERDISKRDSNASRRRSSVADWNSNIHDSKRGDFQKLEVLCFEMEATIASLEEQLVTANEEKENVRSEKEKLALELESVSEKLRSCNDEIINLQEEISCFKSRQEESESCLLKMQSTIDLLECQKEEFAMQLTNALLESEEEKAIWSAKEKASLEAIEERSRSYNDSITSFSKDLSEYHRVQEEVYKLQKELIILQEAKEGYISRIRELETGPDLATDVQNIQDQLANVLNENELLIVRMDEQQSSYEAHMEALQESNSNDLAKAASLADELTGKIANMESEMHKDRVSNMNEKGKLRMRLFWTQEKLEAVTNRYEDGMEELQLMDNKYKEASATLKNKLASAAIKIMNLEKQLASFQGHAML